jgi:type IV pilus assembly protein PilV
MSPVSMRARAGGFSLMEVMISVVVICVGLLGIAKLQGLAMSNANTSRLRALAAIEGASLASAMHSNRDYWGLSAPVTTTVTTTVTSLDAALQTQAQTDLTTGTQPSQACYGLATPSTTAACTSMQLAAFDLARWSYSLTQLLPNPTATISCPPAIGANPTSCTVTITWYEKAVAVNKQELTAASTAAFQLPTYTLYVEP